MIDSLVEPHPKSLPELKDGLKKVSNGRILSFGEVCFLKFRLLGRYVLFKAKIVLLLCLFFIMPSHAQDNTPTVGVITLSDAVSDGYVLYSPRPSRNAYLIDNTGNIVHQWQSALPILSLYLLDNGDLLLSVVEPDNDFPAGGTGRILRYDWDNNLLWSYEFEQAAAQIHHDISLLPNGNILMSMWETVSPDEFAMYGLDPALVPDDGSSLFYDNIIEIDPSNNEIVWQWRMLDHSIQDYDSSLDNYGIPAAHPQRIDINYNLRAANAADRSHINAIEFNPDLNQIMLSVHFYSELWIIDYGTGDLVYRWGNPQAYGRGLPEERLLFNQHNPNWVDNGNILVFNNGARNLRPYSTIVEFTPPLNADGTYTLLEGAAYAPNELVWDYRAEPAESFYSRNVSGAQRLPNGNTFITDGANGRLFEVDAQGIIVWEYLNPLWLDSESATPTSIFRARRYLPDYPAFNGRDLIAQGTIPFAVFEP